MNDALKHLAKNNANTTPANNDFDVIAISIASPDKIRSWSYGEVKKPETINYRTFKPEKDGLFCAKIFGPVKDYECLCGKYKRMKHKGVICEKCGVEVIQQKVRRERMGHIELAAPVVHVWFLKSVPSKIGMLLDINSKDLEKVLYFEKYIVVDPGVSTFKNNEIISEEEYRDTVEKLGESSFKAEMGAEAIKEILVNLDLELEIKNLRVFLQESSSDIKSKKNLKKLKILESLVASGTKPEWMVMDVLPVLPPDLRPLVPLDGGRFATSDLNDLYRRVINRNNRLKRLIEIGAPNIIVRNEKRMLQEAIDALFDNTKRGNPITDGNKRPLKSFADMLKGKQGRFRQNLLGKRVDYSGRSVITVGPYLKLHECGLPKKMALELFKPFIYSKLQSYGIASTIKIAKKIVEKERPEVWDILEEVIKEHPVLLNRAPTLHRLGIQAFEPKLIEGKAIHLHPLVCAAFNADFDGDQMAIHIPLSLEAQLEARVLMMSSNNILSPANGKPIIVPSQDIVLGLYYLSLERDGEKGEGKLFGNISALESALENKVVTHHTKIKYRLQIMNDKGENVNRVVDTTPGRVILSEQLPEKNLVSFDLVNKVLTKKEVANLIDYIYRICGQKATVEFADHLMQLGFVAACKAGISIGKDDLITPKTKDKLVLETEKKVKEYDQQYQEGLITNGERYNKVIDAWSLCTNRIAEDMMKDMFKLEPGQPINSVYMMVHSGARGSIAQMKQLAGMRGLMAKPSGEIIEIPIISNFKEGLEVLEYFNSTHGARKGLADTALKTANAGYLTRRLVDVAQDIIVVNEDCGANTGVEVKAIIEGGAVIESLGERILGRNILEDIKDFTTNKVIIPAGSYIDENLAELVNQTDLDKIIVRSVLSCKEKKGVCQKCYGRDISKGYEVNLGEAVGVVAAQSIGEPGTQLTMRTFHIGGAAQRVADKNSIESPISGTLHLINCRVVINSEGSTTVMSRSGEVVIRDERGQERFRQKLPYGAKIYAKENDVVEFNTKIAEWDSFTVPVITEFEGYVEYADLQDGVSIIEQTDEATGITSKVVTNWKQQARTSGLKPRIILKDSKSSSKAEISYLLQTNTIIAVNNGQFIKPGDILARIPKESAKTRDITGGLPRVIELFEARKYKDAAIVTDISGIVEYGHDYKNRRSIIVRSKEDTTLFFEYILPKDKQLLVYEGDSIERGEQISDGQINPHDILRTKGLAALASHMINEVQDVYKLQGVSINDKHIEVIVRQMLQKVEITDIGDSKCILGDQIDRLEVLRINDELAKENKNLVKFNLILQSITRSSLQTHSFISAASFQETTKILTDSALMSKEDKLEGLKENIIVGRLIPAGTGFLVKKYKEQQEIAK
ncbi:DNA-directed RNA polymerase subunit beta' [Candidatus Hepatincolaceae symbiont of Richtersius coronifer]